MDYRKSVEELFGKKGISAVRGEKRLWVQKDTEVLEKVHEEKGRIEVVKGGWDYQDVSIKNSNSGVS